MPNIEKKQAIVSEIKDKLQSALSVILVDSRGLTAEQDTQLRKKLRREMIKYIFAHKCNKCNIFIYILLF